MNKNTRISLVLTGAMVFSSLGGGLAHADVVINGQTYSDAWIAANPTEVVNFINANPGAAAALLQNNASALAAVCTVYNKTLAECKQIVDETVISTQPKDVVVVGNQAYTNEWITRNQENMNAVVKYVSENPADAATILQNASQSTRDAVLRAVNNGRSEQDKLTTNQANEWIRQNAIARTGRTISGTDRNGAYSNVDIDFLARSMKDGTFNVDNIFTTNHARYALGFTDAQIEEFRTFVRNSTAKQIADKLATFSPEVVIKIDSMRPASSVGIAWRVDANSLARHLVGIPEAWQNILEYAGIPITQAELDKSFRGSKDDLARWLMTLSNDKFEKIQAYAYNAFDMGAARPFFATGWDDKPAYSPEIGRIVSAAEKNAIARIKSYISLTVFHLDAGRGILSAIGKTKQITEGGYAYWKPDAFKEYLTEAAIKDYVANPNKGQFAGGSGTNYCWADQSCATTSGTSTGTTTNTGTNANTGSTSVVVGNPYKTLLPTSAQTKLNTWITTKIVVRSTSLSVTNYSKFIETVIAKLNTIKSTTPVTSKTKLNTIGYLVYELQQIQNSIDDSDSFLDDLFN